MKKITLAILLVFILAGCLNQEAQDVYVTPVITDSNVTKFLYTPGTYTGKGQGYNGQIVVEVTVSESAIISIDIISSNEQNYVAEVITNNNSTDKNEEDESEVPESTVTQETIEVIGSMDSIINSIIALQDLNVETDIQTGATVSCDGLIEAIRQAVNTATLL